MTEKTFFKNHSEFKELCNWEATEGWNEPIFFLNDVEEILDKDYEKRGYSHIKRLMDARKKWIATKKELIKYEQKVRDAILKGLKESDGIGVDIESTNPAECMAGVIFKELGWKNE